MSSEVVRCYIIQHNFISPEEGEIIIECFDRCSREPHDLIPVMGGRQVAGVKYPFGDCESRLLTINWVFATPIGDEACQIYLAKVLRDCADFHPTTADGFATAMINTINGKAAELSAYEADEMVKQLAAEIDAGLLTSGLDH